MRKLTPSEHYLLVKLMEECGETIQICSKIIQFGFDSYHPDTNETNKSLLEKELGDVRCFEELLIEKESISEEAIQQQFEKKYKKFSTS